MLFFANINIMKFVLSLIVGVINIFCGVGHMEDVYFTKALEYIRVIYVYDNGDKFEILQSDVYNKIIVELEDIFINSREMPAFGVSLHEETLESLKNGVWLELEFDDEYNHNGMPYSKLLMQIEPWVTGVNLIRYNKGYYEGRCFYLDLCGKDTTNLYNVLKNINL